MHWVYLLLSAGCSLLIVHLLKVCEQRGLRTLHALTVNYIVAALAALALDPPGREAVAALAAPSVLVFCGLTGAFFILNFLLYSKSVHRNGMGVTVAAMRVSLLFPVLLSILFYRETLSPAKIAGIAGVFGALVLLVPRGRRRPVSAVGAGWMLAAVFLLSGLADASLKIYQEELGDRFSELQFMTLIFLVAFLLGLVFSLRREGTAVTRGELLLGGLIGLPNLGSAVFLIYALRELDGAVAFPLVNALIVLGGTVLGLAFWKDRVSRRQWAGIALALVAIALLI